MTKRFHIQVPAVMNDEHCGHLIELYHDKIAEAELLILDFKLVEDIDANGLLRIRKMCCKINQNCDLRVVNANAKIAQLLRFTPLWQRAAGLNQANP